MIDQYIKTHERFLEHILHETIIPAQRLRQAMHYALFPGGKRIRPVLVYSTGALLGVSEHILDVIAASIELTHCYSLIHDDLPAMDDDDFRRGKPSCHKAFDEATAILVGDGMQVLAIDVLLGKLPPQLAPSQVINITQILLQASGVAGMVSGQSLDLSELSRTDITQDELKQIHHLKTGRLILACIEMVLAASPKTQPHEHDALITYGKHLGLVFQMQDDYLDCYAATQTLGKNRPSDAANEKTTFASLMSQAQLKEEIEHQYHIAFDAINAFGARASQLIELTQLVKLRSQTINVS